MTTTIILSTIAGYIIGGWMDEVYVNCSLFSIQFIISLLHQTEQFVTAAAAVGCGGVKIH